MPRYRTAGLTPRTAVTIATCAVLLLAMAVGLVTAPAARGATVPLLSCQGTETLTFQPPLTNTPTPTLVHYAIDLDLCLGSGVSTGESQGSFVVTASCTTVDVLPPAFSDTYQWNTGASSVATYTAPVETTGNGTVIVTDTGTVTSGLDQGALANETTTLPQLNLAACAGTGVSQLTGPYTLTFA
jgi:hypothetical protein